MSQLDEVKDSYIAGSQKIVDASEELANDSFGFIEIFSKKKLKIHQGKVSKFYGWLREYDAKFSGRLSTQGGISTMQMRQAQVAIVSEARSLFVSSLSAFERELSDKEQTVNFRLSTTIALVAIVVSVVGIV